MHGMTQDGETARVTGVAIHDDDLEMVVGEAFIDYPWDKATIDKAREPLVNNGHTNFDLISRIVFSELAWFFDPSRHEQAPDYGPDAVEKMRQPVLGFSHYRIGPTTLHMLSDLAWS
jgi:hypothetical protein